MKITQWFERFFFVNCNLRNFIFLQKWRGKSIKNQYFHDSRFCRILDLNFVLYDLLYSKILIETSSD